MNNSNECPWEISVTDAHNLLNDKTDNVLLIDVREASEREVCKIDQAIHIPMQQIPVSLDQLPHDKLLLIHCHHGGRSMRVTQFLRANGWDRVTNITGGIDAWALEIDPSLNRY